MVMVQWNSMKWMQLICYYCCDVRYILSHRDLGRLNLAKMRLLDVICCLCLFALIPIYSLRRF